MSDRTCGFSFSAGEIAQDKPSRDRLQHEQVSSPARLPKSHQPRDIAIASCRVTSSGAGETRSQSAKSVHGASQRPTGRRHADIGAPRETRAPQHTRQPRAAKESTCDTPEPDDPATTWPRSLADMRKASYRAWSHQAPGTWEWRPLNAISEATA